MKNSILGRQPARTIAALVAAAVVVPAMCLVVLGMPAEQALLIGAVALIITALVRFPPDGFDLEFPDPPDPVRDRGARREAFRLSWNVAGKRDQVGSTLIARLQQIAARRLADHDLELSNPRDADRIVELTDRTTYQLLTAAPGSVSTSRAFEHALNAVERLATLPPVTHHLYGATDVPTDVPKENG
jgi:hypothetical protein